MNIRAEKWEDEEEIYQLNQLAFKGDEESKLIDKLRTTHAFIPELSLIAEQQSIIRLEVHARYLGLKLILSRADDVPELFF